MPGPQRDPRPPLPRARPEALGGFGPGLTTLVQSGCGCVCVGCTWVQGSLCVGVPVPEAVTGRQMDVLGLNALPLHPPPHLVK